jgi:hypothetical protein
MALLIPSNYALQCVAAPTRAEIDSAHARIPRRTLDIGVMSPVNLREKQVVAKILFGSLVLSSLSIHLRYVNCNCLSPTFFETGSSPELT